jgi:hypothetical protein
MHERIKELALQSYSPYSNFDHEKFAHLIIQECMNVILTWESEPFPLDPKYGAQMIAEHFGVSR